MVESLHAQVTRGDHDGQGATYPRVLKDLEGDGAADNETLDDAESIEPLRVGSVDRTLPHALDSVQGCSFPVSFIRTQGQRG